tara:strand:- start:18151 stop:18936 length:786 start_codon:yes stop_codon:yes gene_type:complete
MSSNRFNAREILEASRPLIGGWVMIDSLMAAETLFALDYDYVGIDCQHSLIDMTQALKLLPSGQGKAPAGLIRVSHNNVAEIGRALDGGADGVIVPMVNSAAEAALAVAACCYHPIGQRSFGPFRAGLGGNIAALQQRACFVMVETEAGLMNVDAIAATEGVTGLYAGPGDLAIALGLSVLTMPTPALLADALTRIARAARNNGIIPAIHAVSPEQAAEFSPLGYAMITLGADLPYLRAGAAADLGALQDLFSIESRERTK